MENRHFGAHSTYEDGFYFNHYWDGLHLASGQSVDYSKLKAIDILADDNGQVKLGIAIVDGRTIEGTADVMRHRQVE